MNASTVADVLLIVAAEAIRDVAFHYIPRLAPGGTGDGDEPMT
jgi:hypothetical protein